MSDSGDDDISLDFAIGDALCFLCLEDSYCTARYHGLQFHKECREAIRCHNGLVANNQQLLNDANKQMLVNPEEWRKAVRHLLPHKEGGCNKTAPLGLKIEFSEKSNESYNHTEVVTEVPLISRAEFLDMYEYQVVAGRVTEEYLAVEWDLQLMRQHRKGNKFEIKDSDGNYMLEYGKKKTTLRIVKGSSTRGRTGCATRSDPPPPGNVVAVCAHQDPPKAPSSKSRGTKRYAEDLIDDLPDTEMDEDSAPVPTNSNITICIIHK